MFIFATRDKSGLKSIPRIYLSAYSLIVLLHLYPDVLLLILRIVVLCILMPLLRSHLNHKQDRTQLHHRLWQQYLSRHRTISLGVKNSPCSPLRFAPTNVSNATPFTSTFVSKREYFCSSAIAKHKHRSFS